MELTDDQLVAEAGRGSEQAMIAIYNKYRRVLISFVLRMTGDADLAEEVFCATFAAFFQTIERYESRGRLVNYLLRIAHSKLINEQKSRRRLGGGEVPAENERLLSNDPTPEDLTLKAETEARVAESLKKLPAHLREVVILRLYEDLDYAMIGEIVGAGEATVRSRMRYALQSLKQTLAEPNSHLRSWPTEFDSQKK